MKRQIIALSAGLALLLTGCAAAAETTQAPNSSHTSTEAAPEETIEPTEETSTKPPLTDFKLPAHDASKAKRHQHDLDEHVTVKFDDTVQFEDKYSISIGNPRLEIRYNEEAEADLLYFLADATITAVGEHFQDGYSLRFDGDDLIQGSPEIFEAGKEHSEVIGDKIGNTILTGKSRTFTLRYVVDTSEKTLVDEASIDFNIGSIHSAVFEF